MYFIEPYNQYEMVKTLLFCSIAIFVGGDSVAYTLEEEN